MILRTILHQDEWWNKKDRWKKETNSHYLAMCEKRTRRGEGVSTSTMRLSTLENELLRPWHFLSLALSSTLSRRTEEVLIKFTVGHFASPSDWLPSILSFLPLLCLSVSSSSSSVFHSRYVSVSTVSFFLFLSLSPSLLSIAKFSTPAKETRVETRVETRMETRVETGMRRDIFREEKSAIGHFSSSFFFRHSRSIVFSIPKNSLRWTPAFENRVPLNRNESRILRKLHRAPILFKQIIWISRDPPGILDILGRNFYSNYGSYYSNDSSNLQSSNRKRSTSIYSTPVQELFFTFLAQILQLIYQLISSTSEKWSRCSR